ncbi:recombinase family protein [Streptomyces sp. ID05-18]|uniref:recombinase family protein n=1 Tax=Streptomyces sp. ID05-18 TaxID=3028662 RepID=UPI00299FACBE|nr:recombinase family protein [Streptomyces sp. ID05-18]MDX3485000.1 recombinase family protein [Streptomyces sp. ID05-18]
MSTVRQNLVLAEAGIEDPVVFEEDPGTSSRLHLLECPKFSELLTYARPDDTVHISEMFRLVRSTGHILDVLDVLHRDRLALRIHDGVFSAMDLTARHPRTGEPLSTVKVMVQTLAAGELQRDLQRELTYDGLRAAAAKGNKGDRRPVVTAVKAAVRAGCLGGRSIAGLARDHHVSRGAVRTAVADLLPEHTAADPGAPAPELPIATGRKRRPERLRSTVTGLHDDAASRIACRSYVPPGGPTGEDSSGAEPLPVVRAERVAEGGIEPVRLYALLPEPGASGVGGARHASRRRVPLSINALRGMPLGGRSPP